MDGKFPDEDLIGFGETPLNEYAKINANRCHPKLLALAGEDGMIDTPDDRVLFCGGGQDFIDGGEATQPSAEVLLIPDPFR